MDNIWKNLANCIILFHELYFDGVFDLEFVRVFFFDMLEFRGT